MHLSVGVYKDRANGFLRSAGYKGKACAQIEIMGWAKITTPGIWSSKSHTGVLPLYHGTLKGNYEREVREAAWYLHMSCTGETFLLKSFFYHTAKWEKNQNRLYGEVNYMYVYALPGCGLGALTKQTL